MDIQTLTTGRLKDFYTDIISNKDIDYLLSLPYQYVFLDICSITNPEARKEYICLYLLQIWSEQPDLRIAADLYLGKSYSTYTDYQKVWLQNMFLNELFLLACSDAFYKAYRSIPLSNKNFQIKGSPENNFLYPAWGVCFVLKAPSINILVTLEWTDKKPIPDIYARTLKLTVIDQDTSEVYGVAKDITLREFKDQLESILDKI